MFNPILHLYPDFGSKALRLDNKRIEEEFKFEDFLSTLASSLKSQCDNMMKGLEACVDIDEEIMAVIRFVHSIETMQMHLELTLEIFRSNSRDEVEQIKQQEKYKLIRSSYEKVNTKEDVAEIPVRHMLLTVHDRMMIPVVKLLTKLFTVDKYGDRQLKRNQHNNSKVKILTHRFETIDIHFPLVVGFDKDDMFCQPKSAQIWQDVYEVATFKQLLTKEEVAASFKPFHFSAFIGHMIVKKLGEMEKATKFQKAMAILKVVLKHSKSHEAAEIATMLHLVNAPHHQALAVWNLTEHPIVQSVAVLNLPVVGYDELIYVPRLYPAITSELIFKEYAEKTLNKIQPICESQLCRIDFGIARSEVIDELFVKNDSKIQIRILAPEHLNIKTERPTIMKHVVQNTAKMLQRSDSVMPTSHGETAIIVHIHGGGFVSCSSGTQRVYLNRWVKNLKLIHFCIDYRLAPQDKYPAGLDDVWQGYLWIVNYAETILGIKNSKIILTGDSAGGNLAMALMLRLVKAGLQPPHGCLLMYPCLYVDALSCSPSYFTSLEDPVLTMDMLKLVAYSYVDPAFNHLEDPFICPMLAGEELLGKLPPIRIVVGSEDALYDDNWRLVHKLRKLKRDVKIIVHENLPHAFLGQPEIKNYNMFIEESCDLVREMIAIEKKECF